MSTKTLEERLQEVENSIRQAEIEVGLRKKQLNELKPKRQEYEDQSIKEFGAFVEFLPKKEGLLHISEISWKRLESMEGIFKEGDKVKVKLLDVDQKTGKFKLSRKALIPKPEMQPRPQQGEQQS